MNLALLLPSSLLALTALLLPLVIHLSRRSEQKPTDFAALRWVSAQLRPRRKLVFQEILLLLLRLLLLLALAFFLAKPVSTQSASPAHWVMVVPGVDTSNLVFDKKAKWHWLVPGFPDFDGKPNASNLPVGSILRELDSVLPASTKITVLVPEQLSGLDGERIRLSRKVEWRIIPTTAIPGNIISVIPAPDKSIRGQAAAGTQRLKPAETSKAESLDPRLRGDDGKMIDADNSSIHLSIRYDEAHRDNSIYFKAAHAFWQSELKTSEKDSLDLAAISTSLKPNRTALIWLASGELPSDIREWIAKGGTAVVLKDSVVPEIKSAVAVWRNEQGKVLARVAALGQGRIVQWQQAIVPDAMPELLDASFPQQLKTLLLPRTAAPTRALAKHQAPLIGAKVGAEAPQALQIWLAVLIALLFVLERWLANAARRWSAA